MDRPPYLILLLVAVVGVIVLAWGVYTKLTAPPPSPASTQPSTGPTLVERLAAERERRLRQQSEPTSRPATAHSSD